MFDWEPRVLLLHYLEQGLSKTAIAERIGISRRCIHKWIAHGDLDRDLDPAGVRHPRRDTQLDPYHALIRQRFETYSELTAVRLFEEVRADGHPGSLTQLKVFVHQVRPVPPPEAIIRFETPPGHQGQVDFARRCGHSSPSALRRAASSSSVSFVTSDRSILWGKRPRCSPSIRAAASLSHSRNSTS